MHPELLLANAHMAARRDTAARRRRSAAERDAARPAAATGLRVTVGQLLVRTGERLSGASPGRV